MDKTKGGIQSKSQASNIRKELVQLKKKVQKKYQQLDSKQGKTELEKLEKIIDENVSGLWDIMEQHDEAEILKQHGETYKSIMDRASGGIESQSQADRIKSELTKLKREIASSKRRIGTDQIKREMDKLMSIIDKNLGQLNNINASATMVNSKDQGIVESHMNAFNAFMKALNEGNMINSVQDLNTIIQLCSNFHENIGKDLSKVSSHQAKEVLKTIQNRLNEVKDQFERHR
jgi:hypothetical protein